MNSSDKMDAGSVRGAARRGADKPPPHRKLGTTFRSQHADQKYLDGLFTDPIWLEGWEWERGDK